MTSNRELLNVNIQQKHQNVDIRTNVLEEKAQVKFYIFMYKMT